MENLRLSGRLNGRLPVILGSCFSGTVPDVGELQFIKRCGQLILIDLLHDAGKLVEQVLLLPQLALQRLKSYTVSVCLLSLVKSEQTLQGFGALVHAVLFGSQHKQCSAQFGLVESVQ